MKHNENNVSKNLKLKNSDKVIIYINSLRNSKFELFTEMV